MNLSWTPVIVIDTFGSIATLILAFSAFFSARRWLKENPEDNFRNYIFLFTLSIVFLAITHPCGYLLKQVLLHFGRAQIWREISPLSGALNTSVFIIIFGFSIYFRRFHKAQVIIDQYQDHLEEMVRDRTDKLNEQVAFQQQLIDSIPSPVYFKDIEGKYLGCNKAFVALTGLDMKKIVGRTEHELIGKDTAGKHHKMDLELIRNNKIIAYESRLSFPGAEGHEAIFHKAPFLDISGKPAGMIGTFIDISERQNFERRLRQTQKMETIGTLAGGIAHDFNNILAAILGFSELALQKMAPESPQASDIKQVIKASVRAKDLVKQILSFSRQDKKKRTPIKIAPIVTDIKRILEAGLPSDIEIKTHFGQEAGVVLADHGQIHQALLNICKNAVQSMEDKGGCIEISVESDTRDHSTGDTSSNGNYTRISIRDYGSGIADEIIERIYEPFFTSRKFGQGTGMGLSVAHGIIQNHGGVIEVDSKVNQGTEFIIFLPAKEQCQQDVPPREIKPPKGSETILFIDDEPILVNMGVDMLSRLGYQVDGLTGSLEAFEAIKNNPHKYHLVITDHVMPYMRGVELAAEIKKINPQLPIMICSGFSEEEIHFNEDSENIKAFVSKPILTNDFAATIRKVLDSGGNKTQPNDAGENELCAH